MTKKRFLNLRLLLVCLVMLSMVFLTMGSAYGANQSLPLPTVQIGVDGAQSPQQTSTSLQILFLMTVLSLAPSILVMMTAFTRIIVVLSFVRSALATQQMPPNQVLVGLALFLTLFIMAPTWAKVNQSALQPYMAGKITQEQAIDKGMEPVRTFMFKQTREKDLALMVSFSENKRPKTRDDITNFELIPAFIMSELKTAFQIGFFIFIPFIVIDMIVSSALMSMGMMMLPPMMISLPFKILLFVMVDGWYLVVRSLIMSFQ